MKKIHFLYLFVVCAISTIFILSCSTSTEPETKPTLNGRVYDNPEIKFRITAPEGWTMKKDQSLSSYIALVVGTRDVYNYFQPNFSVIAEKYSGSRPDMNTMLDAAESAIKDAFEDVTVVLKTPITVDKQPCGLLMCKIIMQDVEVRINEIYMFHMQHFLILTFSALQEEYADVQADFSIILNSIKLY